VNIPLIFPPHWVVHQPYLSLPSLTAYLRENGYNVIHRDINIESEVGKGTKITITIPIKAEEN